MSSSTSVSSNKASPKSSVCTVLSIAGARFQAFDLLLIRPRELIAKQRAKTCFGILHDIAVLIFIQIPVAQFRWDAKDRAFLQLSIEFFLQPIGIELSQHRFKSESLRGLYRLLMITNILQRFRKGLGRCEIRTILLDQQVVERIFSIC